jgi:hypothetical protein
MPESALPAFGFPHNQEALLSACGTTRFAVPAILIVSNDLLSAFD